MKLIGLSILAASLLLFIIVCVARRKQLGMYFKILTPVFSVFFVLVCTFLVMNIMVTDNGDKVIDQHPREETRKMDMIMWYDIDTGKTTNGRPQQGWWYLNPQHPDTVKVSGCYRAANPLMGLYDQRDPETARQHLYWMTAMGCNGVAVDWTNYTSYRKANDADWLKYTSGVYKNTEVLLKTARETKDFETPKIYCTVRLTGEDYEKLRDILEDVYTLYTEYSDAWYIFDDGTGNRNKPFLIIFADQSIMKKFIDEGEGFTDARFNIRWSNGYLGSISSESKGNRTIPYGNWLFVEAEKEDNPDSGLYKAYYAKGADGKPEQMIGWASVHLGGTSWDKMNNIVNGKTTFERTIWKVKELKPKALLVNRFNYAVAWKEEPQEGLSLYECTNIEPTEEYGFLIFDNVKKNLYYLNDWKEDVFANVNYTRNDNVVKVTLEGYPTEYRISKNGDMSGSEWSYLNINEWIDCKEEGKVYLQLRNCFGESEIFEIN